MSFSREKEIPMRLRTFAAGLLLAVAIAPTAVAAPKNAPAPAPISGTSTPTQSPEFFCPIFPWLAMCHPR